MTLDERIEAAARVLEKKHHVLGMFKEAGDVLEAAFPEFFSSPPTHWPAPWEATEEMIEAAWRADYEMTRGMAERAFQAARDAYLNREGK